MLGIIMNLIACYLCCYCIRFVLLAYLSCDFLKEFSAPGDYFSKSDGVLWIVSNVFWVIKIC